MKPRVKIAVILLLLFWFLPGTVGRDPWKADEPYSLGMTMGIMHTGDWVVPEVAGVPFLEKPPLYYLSAAAAGSLLTPPLAVHDAVRLVNGLWLLAVFLCLFFAVREISSERAAWTAPVLLAGCLLLEIPAHKLLTDVGLLAGFSIGIYGMVLGRRRPVEGGILTGVGTGIGFLTKGLLAPGIIAVTALLLPLLFREWRHRGYALSLFTAVLAVLPFLIIWPLALYLRSPEYFKEWFWYQNFGRFFGFARIGNMPDSHWFYLKHLLWLTWPLLPIALWTLWRTRRDRGSAAVWQLPLTLTIVLFTVLSLSESNREIYALPMLLPLTMIAATGSELVPQRVLSGLHAGGAALFGFLGAALWSAVILKDSGRALLEAYLPGPTVHYPAVSGLLVLCALICTGVWIASIVFVGGREAPLLFSWSSGIALVWALAMTLWLPWFEAQASYRDTFRTIVRSLPENRICIASFGMGESERAMLEYYAGLRALPIETNGSRFCDLLIIGEGGAAAAHVDSDDWVPIWTSCRPTVHPKEHYTVYKHVASGATVAGLITPRMIHRD